MALYVHDRRKRYVRRMRPHDQLRVNGGLQVCVDGTWRHVVKIVRDQRRREWNYLLRIENQRKQNDL